MKLQIQLMKIAFDFLDSLSEKEIMDIINKDAKLSIKYKNKSNIIDVDEELLEELTHNINNFDNRDEAIIYINNLKLTKVVLKELAIKNNVFINSKDTNNIIISKIVEKMIGSKLKFDTLLNSNIK